MSKQLNYGWDCKRKQIADWYWSLIINQLYSVRTLLHEPPLLKIITLAIIRQSSNFSKTKIRGRIYFYSDGSENSKLTFDILALNDQPTTFTRHRKGTFHFLKSGWPHSSHNENPCVFPEFSLCYRNFPCVILCKNQQLAQWIKATLPLYYYIQKHANSFFKMWIIWSVSIVKFSKYLLIEGSRVMCPP